MANVLLKRIEVHPSPRDVSPRPDESATVWVDVSISGLKTLELPLHISPLTSMDDALAQASERLRSIGQEIVDAAGVPLLPLPREAGIFDKTTPGYKIVLHGEKG